MDILLLNKTKRKAFSLMFQVCLLDTEMQSVTKTWALQFAEDRGFSERLITLLFLCCLMGYL